MRIVNMKILRYITSIFLSISVIIGSIAIVSATTDTSVASLSSAVHALYEPTTYETEAIEMMEVVAENSTLILYIDRASAGIAVKDKRSGKLWFSIPPNMSEDTGAAESSKSRMRSCFGITFHDANGQKKTMDSYTDSVKKGQFTIQNIKDGVKVIYLLGSKAKGIEDVPKSMFAKRFNQKFLDKVTSEEDREYLLEKYIYIEEDDMYMLSGYTNMPKGDLENILRIIDEVGYTADDLRKDHMDTGVPPADQDKVYYEIPIEYTIEGENLISKLPLKEVDFSKKYPLNLATINEFFGAAYGKEVPGYMFLPDGSGTLLDFNVPPKPNDQYYTNIYGLDQTIHIAESKIVSEQVRLPVYGLKRGDYAFFAVIEDGDAMGRLVATKASRLHSFNCVFPEFQIVNMDNIRLGDGNIGTNVLIFQQQIYQGDIKIRYSFLNGDNANYNGMAEVYRNYVMERYNINKLTPKKDIPFILDTVGTVRKDKSFLGIYYRGQEPLTTFKQSSEIAQRFKDAGVNNISMRISAWFNEGVRQLFMGRQVVEKVLGGPKELKNLINYGKENDIDIYPNVQMLTAVESSPGFSKFKYAAKRVDERTARAAAFDIVTWARTYARAIISPAKLELIVNRFIKDVSKYSFTNMAFEDVGRDLYSDFKASNNADRQNALKLQANAINNIMENVGPVMCNGGNMVAMPYSKMAINTPIDDSSYNISDQSVPFYQMVFHGLIDYAAYPVNLSNTIKRDMLRMIQTGCSVYFQLSYAPSKMVKETVANSLYSMNVDNWFDTALEFYNRANAALKDLQNKFMVKHTVIAKNVEEVEYEDGTRMIFNYNTTPYSANGITIQAEDFIVIKGGN